MSQNISRREVLKLGLLIPLHVFISACEGFADEKISGASQTEPLQITLHNDLRFSSIPCPTRNLSDIRFATLHHSEVNPGASNLGELMKRAKRYDQDHSKKLWAEKNRTGREFRYAYIQYHWLVARDGAILAVQHPKYQRVHATDDCRGDESHNKYGIAICVDGNFDYETPSKFQIEAVNQILRNWKTWHGKELIVSGHSQLICPGFPQKSCPGVNFDLSQVGI